MGHGSFESLRNVNLSFIAKGQSPIRIEKGKRYYICKVGDECSVSEGCNGKRNSVAALLETSTEDHNPSRKGSFFLMAVTPRTDSRYKIIKDSKKEAIASHAYFDAGQRIILQNKKNPEEKLEFMIMRG